MRVAGDSTWDEFAVDEEPDEPEESEDEELGDRVRLDLFEECFLVFFEERLDELLDDLLDDLLLEFRRSESEEEEEA